MNLRIYGVVEVDAAVWDREFGLPNPPALAKALRSNARAVAEESVREYLEVYWPGLLVEPEGDR